MKFQPYAILSRYIVINAYKKIENAIFLWPNDGDSDSNVILILSLIKLVDDEDNVG